MFFYFLSSGTFYNRDYMLEIPDLQQLELLGTPKRLNDVKMPKCLKCKKFRVLLELNPDSTNWLLIFGHNGTRANNNLSPLLSDIPQIIQIGDIIFKLEYLTYRQEVPNCPGEYHEVSMQFIRQTWYLYDGTRSPKFRRWGGKNYTNLNAILDTIVYFKI
jgi:hypothetical protein